MENAMTRKKPGLPSARWATCAIDWPLSRMLTKRLEKSWTAPMNTAPKTTQSQTGMYPYIMATVGPTLFTAGAAERVARIVLDEAGAPSPGDNHAA